MKKSIEFDSNFSNMKLTTYSRLTRDDSENMIHIYDVTIIVVTGVE